MITRPCTVWWAAPVAPVDAAALVALLDEHERTRMERFRRDIDRARYLAAHALVRIAVGREVGRAPGELEFDRTCRCGEQHGKPRLTGAGPAFSLTHAGELVGVALHEHEVGVDVEQVRVLNDLAAMATHSCSPAERAAGAVTGAVDFFRLWTRKEALIKATGDGLSTPMSDITITSGGAVEWSGSGAPAGPVWLHDLAPADGHLAAVAGLGPVAPPVVEADGDALLVAGA